MSTHKDCGEEIRWAKRDDDPDRFRPPLEYAGEAFIIDERGAAIQVHTYRPHNCDPDKVEAWLTYQKRLAVLRGDTEGLRELTGMEAHNAARERDRENTWEHALKKPCPRCRALVGVKCHRLDQKFRKTGEMVESKNPHPERIDY